MFQGKISTLDAMCRSSTCEYKINSSFFFSLCSLKEIYAVHIVEWIRRYRLLMEADGLPFARLIRSGVQSVWHIFNVFVLSTKRRNQVCVVNPPPSNAHRRPVDTTKTTLLNVNLVFAVDPDVICLARWFHKPLGRSTRAYNYEMRMGTCFSHISISTFFKYK